MLSHHYLCFYHVNPQKPTKYRRAVSHDSKEYYKRRSAFAALESVPIEEGTETESTHMDADHGDDTIAHVRGQDHLRSSFD